MTPGVLSSLIDEHEYATTDKPRRTAQKASIGDALILARLPLRSG